MPTPAFDAYSLSVLLVLGVAVPLLGIWDFRRLLRWDRQGRGNARLNTYRFLLMLEWGLTLGLLGGWLADGRSLETLRFVSGYHRWEWLAVALGLAAAGFMLWQLASVLRKVREGKKIQLGMGDLRALAPRTPAELRLFDMVSVTAGVCEEILYRGILLVVLGAAVGLWPAVALSSVIFGLGHVYQGLEGLVKTTVVGLIMALLTVFSGSLLIAVILHAVIDLTSGRMMAAALAGEGPATKVPAPAAPPSPG